MRIIDEVFDVEKIYFGLEDDMMEAAEVLEEKTKDLDKFVVKVLQSQYPQGSEKQLIENCTGRQVPSGGLPSDVGCVVSNVETVPSSVPQIFHY